MNPSISAIVACHNAAPHLGQCLSSLRGFEEVLLIDDGSTDESHAIAQAFPHVHILGYHAQPHGASATKAELVAATTGEAVCIIDADDYLFPNPRLDERFEALQAPGAQVVSTPVDVLGRGVQYPHGDLWSFALSQGAQAGALMWRGDTLRSLVRQGGFLPGCFELQCLLRLCQWHLDQAQASGHFPSGHGVIRHLGGRPAAAYRADWSQQQQHHQTRQTRLAIVEQVWGLLPSYVADVYKESCFERSMAALQR
jgi:hypothetical protein